MNLFQGTPDFLLIAVGVLVLVAAILILAAGRRDDDVGGTRTQARYVGAIGIITLFVALLAEFEVVRALTGFIVDGHDDNQLYRDALENGLLMLAAGAVFVFHHRREVALAPAGRLARGATGSVARATLYGVCFVAAILAFLAASKAVYAIFQIIAPGVFGEGAGAATFPPLDPAVLLNQNGFEELSRELFAAGGGGLDGGDVARQQGISDLLSYGVLTLGSLFVFLRAWNWLPEHR
jgi:hypothetical protein